MIRSNSKLVLDNLIKRKFKKMSKILFSPPKLNKKLIRQAKSEVGLVRPAEALVKSEFQKMLTCQIFLRVNVSV